MGWDSNPRKVTLRRFSRPLHSTTLPPIQMAQKRERIVTQACRHGKTFLHHEHSNMTHTVKQKRMGWDSPAPSPCAARRVPSRRCPAGSGSARSTGARSPRKVTLRRFSRPLHSTTLPPIQMAQKRECIVTQACRHGMTFLHHEHSNMTHTVKQKRFAAKVRIDDFYSQTESVHLRRTS